MILRPYGLILDGELQLGLELVLDGQRIAEVRPHTGVPEPFVVSPAFVNAHSHLEYRGFLGALNGLEYWPWIREITRLKGQQELADVRRDTFLAAKENRATGVALIAEHSDRPYAGEALASAGIEGVIFQELITFLEQESPEEKWRGVEERAALQRDFFSGPVRVAPHAPYTVDSGSLEKFAFVEAGDGLAYSIHVAETPFENDFFREGKGPIADFYRAYGFEAEALGMGVVGYLDSLGLVRKGAQFVHCCDISDEDIEQMAIGGVSVAHCPRSNKHLGCPPAPVRRMVEAGILVGLGLDSAASSGPIDFLAEMHATLSVSRMLGEPLSTAQVWHMATAMGASSLGFSDWEICVGSQVPLIKIHMPGCCSIEELIEARASEPLEWVREYEQLV